MTGQPKNSTTKRASQYQWWITAAILNGACVLLAHFELERIAAGKLLLLAFPWEAKPSTVEGIDAKLSVSENYAPALIALLIIGMTVMLTWPIAKKSWQEPRLWTRSVITIFAFAVLADMFSTIWFFHVQGIDFEFHPAIRLFGYAYGRTVGPIAGKLIQAAGILYVAILLKGQGRFLIYVVTAVYLFASIYNVSQTLAVLKT